MSQSNSAPLNHQYDYSSDGDVTTTRNSSELLTAVYKLLPSSKSRLLEIGCGNGYGAAHFAEQGHRVTAIDTSQSGIAIAKNSYPKVEKFEVASVYDDPLQEFGIFDVVVSLEVIEHLFLPRKLLQVAYRSLRPGGHFIISTPYHGYLKNLALAVFNKWDNHLSATWDGGHVKFFSKPTLAKLLMEEGFQDLRFVGVGRCYGLWKSMVFKSTKP